MAPGQDHWRILRSLLAGRGAAANLTSDARLAAIAIEHGATLCSADNDYRRFACLVHRNALKRGRAALSGNRATDYRVHRLGGVDVSPPLAPTTWLPQRDHTPRDARAPRPTGEPPATTAGMGNDRRGTRGTHCELSVPVHAGRRNESMSVRVPGPSAEAVSMYDKPDQVIQRQIGRTVVGSDRHAHRGAGCFRARDHAAGSIG